jgi:hypothetical protein
VADETTSKTLFDNGMELVDTDSLNGLAQFSSSSLVKNDLLLTYLSTEKEQMRHELEEYLKEFKNRKDENGVPFVHFPSNFDSIADAMSRKDLNSNDNKSAPLYLLFNLSPVLGANLSSNQSLMMKD